MKNLIALLLCTITFTIIAEAGNSIRFNSYPSKLSSKSLNKFNFKYSADHLSILYVQIFDENWRQVKSIRGKDLLPAGTNKYAYAHFYLNSSNSSKHYVQVKLYSLSHRQIGWDQRVYYGNLNKNASLSNTAESGIKLNAYPNPVKDYINLEYTLEKEGEVDIEIYNPTGKLVKVIQTGENLDEGMHTKRIDASFLDTGMYLVKIATEEENQISKILKQ